MKDIVWHPWLGENAPLSGALLFAVSAAALTIWYSAGAPGPWGAAFGLCAALIIIAVVRNRALSILLPTLLGLSAFSLVLLSGGLTGPALSAVLWPILGVAASSITGNTTGNTTGPNTNSPRQKYGFGPAIASSLGVLVCLVLVDHIAAIPVSEFVALPSALCAIGVCAALSVAASVRLLNLQRRPQSPPANDVVQLLQSRDEALLEAKVARTQNQEHAQFMAEMSHEIRTPLNAILGFADTMRAEVFGPLPQPYYDYPELIHKSGAHLLDVVSDLLDLSKIEAGRYEAKVAPVSLNALASEGVAVAAGSARMAGITLREELGDPVMILGDARGVRQMIFNLVSNAIKFTPSGGQIIVRTALQGDKASLIVDDTGVGISEADLTRIGQPWNQATNARSEAVGKNMRGSGLGLALVKRLAELQAATFALSSTLGVGTTATISFPLAVLPEQH